MFSTLLIANRGEIARRVIRTARRLGIRTVAAFTEADASAAHVAEAEEAVLVGSYLDIDDLVAAATARGVDAVHPGYGFLSERGAFARAVAEAGLVLVGPSAAVMDLMGRKDAAREAAIAAGVPVVPRGEDAGFPVLVKAAAGGGGKGMRLVRSAAELDQAMAAARREAGSAFGDDTLLIERYVEHGRHIEVQVIADRQGSVLHLYERDCSTQRRHQKVIEEAPAPTLTAEARDQITSAAVALARHVGYLSAGTVEFLLDPAAGVAYFLEMNTRLQVEHAVTEAITGLDLVELQLRVAAGEPLPITQDEVSVSGHAIEARVYAEDAFDGFLPQAGRAGLVHWPSAARCDEALASGQPVGTGFDPMLGKVIAHGADREAARRALIDALDDTAILGLTTNVGFLRQLLAGEEFRDAAIDTAWLDAAELSPPDPGLARIFAAWAFAREEAAADRGPLRADGWRLGGPAAPIRVELDHPVAVYRPDRDGHVGEVDGHRVVQLAAARPMVLEIDGEILRAWADVGAHQVEVVLRGHRFVFRRPDRLASGEPGAGDGRLVAPMPGTVLEVRVAAAEQVAAGQVVAVLEAMKMELTVRAPFDGRVARVAHRAGDQVQLGTVLVVVEPVGEVPADEGG